MTFNLIVKCANRHCGKHLQGYNASAECRSYLIHVIGLFRAFFRMVEANSIHHSRTCCEHPRLSAANKTWMAPDAGLAGDPHVIGVASRVVAMTSPAMARRMVSVIRKCIFLHPRMCLPHAPLLWR
jgi:hypothetical protein